MPGSRRVEDFAGTVYVPEFDIKGGESIAAAIRAASEAGDTERLREIETALKLSEMEASQFNTDRQHDIERRRLDIAVDEFNRLRETDENFNRVVMPQIWDLLPGKLKSKVKLEKDEDGRPIFPTDAVSSQFMANTWLRMLEGENQLSAARISASASAGRGDASRLQKQLDDRLAWRSKLSNGYQQGLYDKFIAGELRDANPAVQQRFLDSAPLTDNERAAIIQAVNIDRMWENKPFLVLGTPDYVTDINAIPVVSPLRNDWTPSSFQSQIDQDWDRLQKQFAEYEQRHGYTMPDVNPRSAFTSRVESAEAQESRRNYYSWKSGMTRRFFDTYAAWLTEAGQRPVDYIDPRNKGRMEGNFSGEFVAGSYIQGQSGAGGDGGAGAATIVGQGEVTAPAESPFKGVAVNALTETPENAAIQYAGVTAAQLIADMRAHGSTLTYSGWLEKSGVGRRLNAHSNERVQVSFRGKTIPAGVTYAEWLREIWIGVNGSLQ
jgi:hypothetical protein